MPELPEVETMRRGIAAAVGRMLVAVERLPCPRKPITIRPRLDRWPERVARQPIVAVGRAGKRVVVELASGDAIVIEPRMTGLVLTADPPDPLYLRLRFHLDGPASRGQRRPWFDYWDRRGIGVVQLLTPRERLDRLGPTKLGPDALTVTADVLHQQLARSRRPIKIALLDQQRLAGIGNLYAAEILHVARISPRQRCDRLTKPQWQALAAATTAVLTEAIRYEGSTLGDGTYRNALSQAGSYQNHHRVYDRQGELCPTCRETAIERIVQAQRSTFFCPQCQTTRRQPRVIPAQAGIQEAPRQRRLPSNGRQVGGQPSGFPPARE